MFEPQHYGLYYNPAQVQIAHERRDSEPFRSAWAWLAQGQQIDLPTIAQCNALRYRLDGDQEAGERAIDILLRDALKYSASDQIDQIGTLMSYAQCFEMLRDHPAFDQQQAWLADFAVLSHDLMEVDTGYVSSLWRNSLRMVTSIVLEDQVLFQNASETFEAVIHEDVHPEGYIRQAALDGSPGDSLYHMLLAAQALILCAEAARHAGRDLWALNLRGVSVATPAPYLLYYYYYPEKWRWDAVKATDLTVPEEGLATLDVESVQHFYSEHAGIWEMAQHHQHSPDREMLLNELRPVFDLWGGGLVSLTHGASPSRQRRFRLF